MTWQNPGCCDYCAERDCDGRCVRRPSFRFLGSIIRWWGVFIWIVLILFFLFLKANAEGAGKNKPELDPAFYVNQNSYTLGTVRAITVVRPDARKTWTVVDFVPSYTPLLYPGDELLFCGNVSDKFAGLTSADEIVIVYGRAVEVTKAGSPPSIFACHNLHAIRFVRKTDNLDGRP